MKKIAMFLMILSTTFCFGYQDLLNLIELKKNVDEIKSYKEIESFADLNLWYLEQTQPKIFIRMERAYNATPLAYFREEYYNSSKLGKLFLIKKYFNIK